MKNTGKCPKCRSADISRILPSGDDRSAHSIPVGFMSYTLLTTFLCCKCGYAEQWAEDEQDLLKIRKRYKLYQADEG